ncbi:hypothetical protein AZE42_03674 [Rhizopogon vesiculosus]|uniref:Uncharacterized protein n=1 Tax=Rhizopogon vesiculosus TaxID=180088 RepID=A0A1J8PJG6_9AGAM|nr:hypothetical protein AZE42_03674 [Rhizopogon vesiculosus]
MILTLKGVKQHLSCNQIVSPNAAAVERHLRQAIGHRCVSATDEPATCQSHQGAAESLYNSPWEASAARGFHQVISGQPFPKDLSRTIVHLSS